MQCDTQHITERPDSLIFYNVSDLVTKLYLNWRWDGKPNYLSRLFGCSNIPQVMSTVVERTIEDQKKQDPAAGQEEPLIMRDPFESGSVSI